MLIYIIVVFGIVAVTSALLIYILNKLGLLDYRMVLAISLSSVLAGLLFPGIFNLLSAGSRRIAGIAQVSFVLVATLVMYMLLVFILSVIIAVIIPGSTFDLIAAGMKKIRINGAARPFRLDENGPKNDDNAKGILNEGTNYLEEIYDSFAAENAKTVPDNEVYAQDNEAYKQPVDEAYAEKAENNLDKSVDSGENIDKMGLEEFEQDISMRLSIEECVEEAFRLKSEGDFEGAILYFMYALDKKPGPDLTFWIVLDICVLYKLSGQVEFAKDVLSSYFDIYGNYMDAGTREEIERNLAYIGQ